MIDLLLAAVHAAPAGGLGGPADMWAAIVKDFANITEPAAMAAFLQVLMIDLVLAGDNAIVVGALSGLVAAAVCVVISLRAVAKLSPRALMSAQALDGGGSADPTRARRSRACGATCPRPCRGSSSSRAA